MEGYAVLQADGAGRAVLQNQPSSVSVWQTLAMGLAPWLTLKSWVLQGKKDGFPLVQTASTILWRKDAEGFLKSPSSSTM